MFVFVSGEGIFNDIWFLEGDVLEVDKIVFVGGCGFVDFNLIVFYGIFMFFGWGIFF